MATSDAPVRVYRSVDVGYRNTKIIVNDEGHCHLIPSLAPPADPHRARTALMRERRTSIVYVDGIAYEVGEDAGLFVSGASILHRDYIETPEYRALFYGALEAMQAPVIDLLVTGLPVHLYETRWERLKALLRGRHEIRPGVVIDVREVAVTLQPLGSLLAFHHEHGAWHDNVERTFLVIDPGYFTFDWLVTRGLKELPGLSGSIECGMSEYVRLVGEQLSARLGDVQTDLARIDDGLRSSNFRLNGQRIDLDPFQLGAEQAVERAIGALRNRIGNGQTIDQIIVTGGGAPYFVPGLTRSFPKHSVRVLEAPVSANVRGFQLIAQFLGRRMSV
jgi:plasmid segregation protein ParM